MQDQSHSTPEVAFGQATRRLRDARGWPQTELAARLERRGIRMDGTAVTRLERGTRSIRLNEAVAIVAELGATSIEQMIAGPASGLDEELAHAMVAELEAQERYAWAVAERDAARARRKRLEQEVGKARPGQDQT